MPADEVQYLVSVFHVFEDAQFIGVRFQVLCDAVVRIDPKKAEHLKSRSIDPFDVVIANPPYVPLGSCPD